jgi:cell filamentation protein
VSYLRSEHERVAYRRTFYAGTEVYVNKLAIRDGALLEDTERAITRRRARQGFPSRAHHRSYDGYRAIHRHLFRDLYAWAGKERPYTTGRGAIPFAVPEHIGTWMQQQFNTLAREGYLVGLDLDAFAEAAARYVNEINAAHPFIDGNGRTQRFWLRMLADNAGFDLTLRDSDRKRWNEASRLGFVRSDHAPMAALLKARLKKRADERPAMPSRKRVRKAPRPSGD